MSILFVNTLFDNAEYILGIMFAVMIFSFITKYIYDCMMIRKQIGKILKINAKNILFLESLKIPFDENIERLQEDIYFNFETLSNFKIKVNDIDYTLEVLKIVERAEIKNQKNLYNYTL